jgi:hypothetical protein
LFDAHQRWADALFGARLEQAVSDLAWPLKARRLRQAIATVRLADRDFQRTERRGLHRIERAMRRSNQMPGLFAANPAQAFFQLQRHVADRRRREADGELGDHLPADEAVRIAG